MTLADSPRARLRPPPRPETERVADQLAGIDALTRTSRDVQAWAAEAGSREMRLDRARRLDVVRRQHRALVEATARQLRDSGDPLTSVPTPRVVVAHRNDWFKDKVGRGLRARCMQVVAELSNGADAVGVVLAEQPELLLLEDKLPMQSALEVLAEVRRWAPQTLVTVQVANDWDIGPFLDAGACQAFTRRVPPADIADALCHLLAA